MSQQLFDILCPMDHEQSGKIHGVMIGRVTDNKDPDHQGRVRVHIYGLDVQSTWAYIVTPMAGAGRGMYFLPEVDDVVLLAFVHGYPDYAYIMGSVWQGNNGPPANNSDGENNIRMLQSRSGHVFCFSDKAGDEKIEIIDKTGGNSITIKAADNSITIACTGKMILQADQGIEITSESDVTIQGATVNIN
jgi:uncharacterized protein involved in type VI secretion and phage assembly